MDGVHPLCCVLLWNGGVCAAAVCSVRVAQPASRPSQCSTHQYCCRVMLLFVAGCVVCVGECPSVLLCVVGYPLSATPSSWWWVGALWMVGWHGEVGWYSDGRAGAAVLTLPSVCRCPPRLVSTSPPVCSVGVLNGGSGMCCDAPRRIGFGVLRCLVSPCIAPP